MRKKRLGRSGLRVSEIGLGVMNFGSQLTEKESFAVGDAALDLGITLFDTAEMYSSPPTPESYGRSEEILGRWLKTKGRDQVIVATKMIGPSDGMFKGGAYIRSGQSSLDAFHIGRAIDDSLKRLGTDHIDLMQFHWPDRIVPWAEQLGAMTRAIAQGKIRYFGCSNETPWGLMRAVACSERNDLTRPISVQNVLNFLQADHYQALEECCLQEGIGYVAYSPLAMGLLTGKYRGHTLPEGTRFELFKRYRDMYLNDAKLAVVDHVAREAEKRNVSVGELSLWWCLTRPAVSTVLTTVSKVEQLSLAVRAVELAEKDPDLQIDLAGLYSAA
jgi:aryl-alcohol dehydrogenase-like predicted oxidoreductase